MEIAIFVAAGVIILGLIIYVSIGPLKRRIELWSFNSKLEEIKKGMSCNEVENVLGKPNYVNTYSKKDTIIYEYYFTYYYKEHYYKHGVNYSREKSDTIKRKVEFSINNDLVDVNGNPKTIISCVTNDQGRVLKQYK